MWAATDPIAYAMEGGADRNGETTNAVVTPVLPWPASTLAFQVVRGELANLVASFAEDAGNCSTRPPNRFEVGSTCFDVGELSTEVVEGLTHEREDNELHRRFQ